MAISAAIVANLVVLGVLVYSAILAKHYPEFYYRSTTEDAYIEWMTFWSFLIGAGVFVLAAIRQRRATGRIPWFLAGVGLFCFFVAMEEISWGQRLLGYQPPIYFLENNSHQEMNFHNTVSNAIRQHVFLGVIGGYGVLLPLAMAVPVLGRWLRKVAVIGPSAWLVPSFLSTFVLYHLYPWKFTGEVAELMLGLSFLSAGVAVVQGYGHDRPRGNPYRVFMLNATLFGVVLSLGLGSSAWASRQRHANPAALEAARIETAALMDDLLTLTAQRGFDVPTQCGTHHRLGALVRMGPLPEMFMGNFSALQKQGLFERRAKNFIDPWNSSYWIWHRSCDEGSHTICIYSLGPNRLRESTFEGLGGDDIGDIVVIDRPLQEILSERLWRNPKRAP